MKNNDLAIIALNSFSERGKRVEEFIQDERKDKKNYLTKITQVRFSNGEAKIRIDETVRGKDVYILADVGNYNVTYKMFGADNRMSPDDHFQDIKRAIGAVMGRARRITVVMPLLYCSRQHRRTGRESLDCAMALQELVAMGISGIVTFDAHDPNVVNAIPLVSFDNILPTYPILREFIQHENRNIHKDNMLIVSPDAGAMGRAVYYANMLGLNVGMVYKRRDHSVVVNGKNPIVEHSYTGPDVKGKSILIVDDMIASGGSMLEVAVELKNRGAKEINIISTFAFFNEGTAEFDKLHKEGVIKAVYSTNLSHIGENVRKAEWFVEVDLTKFLALIINTLNNETSISPLIDSQKRISELLEEFRGKK